MTRPKRFVACTILRKQLGNKSEATRKQLGFGAGGKKLMMLMKDFLLYTYIETMLMRHFAPPTTLGTEEWRALWLASHAWLMG